MLDVLKVNLMNTDLAVFVATISLEAIHDAYQVSHGWI